MCSCMYMYIVCLLWSTWNGIPFIFGVTLVWGSGCKLIFSIPLCSWPVYGVVWSVADYYRNFMAAARDLYITEVYILHSTFRWQYYKFEWKYMPCSTTSIFYCIRFQKRLHKCDTTIRRGSAVGSKNSPCWAMCQRSCHAYLWKLFPASAYLWQDGESRPNLTNIHHSNVIKGASLCS